MSIIFCDLCNRHVDTDFETNGISPSLETNLSIDYICERCISTNEMLQDIQYESVELGWPIKESKLKTAVGLWSFSPEPLHEK